jgi:uncharacterized phage-associated protein
MFRPNSIDVARYILWYASRREIGITNLKLQKLLFFCQGWYLALKGAPLFEGRLEAWPKGGANYECWREYRQWQASPIDLIPTEAPLDADLTVLNGVLDDYLDLDQWMLVTLSHGSSWAKARGGLADDAASKNEIRLDWMTEEFLKLAAQRDAIERSSEETPDAVGAGAFGASAFSIGGLFPVKAGDAVPVTVDGEGLIWRITQRDLDKIGRAFERSDSGRAVKLTDEELRARLNLPATSLQ